jgi:hypothetical protein
VKYRTTALAILAALSVSVALAEDFKTINGKEYKNATVTRAEPDGITIKFSGGLVKIPFTELPEEVQERFHYDPANAAQFNAAVQAEQNPSPASSAEQVDLSVALRLGLDYTPPDQLIADARKAAEAKAFSPEEEKQRLRKYRQVELVS